MRLADLGFRPPDIFFDEVNVDPTTDKGRKRLAELQDAMVHPSAVEHLKKLGRYNKALGLYFGTSRAAMLPQTASSALKGALQQISELVPQIYTMRDDE